MKTDQKIGTTIFIGLLFLIMASPSSALELLTYRSYFPSGNVELEYTYYLDTAGRQVLHGTRTWYRTPLEVGVIQRYSHGKQHGLEEAWYADSYDYGRSKHWEKEYQDGLLHGVSREWYPPTHADGMAKETVLRFGPINKSQQKIQLEYGGGIGYLGHTKESLQKTTA